MNSVKNLAERLRTLETERKNLLLEVEELRKMADARTKALESEISMLREEVKSLRVLLGAEGTAEAEVEKKKKK